MVEKQIFVTMTNTISVYMSLCVTLKDVFMNFEF